MLSGHKSSVWCASFSPDGRRVFTASHDGTLKVWDADGGKELISIPGHRKWHAHVGIAPSCRCVLVSGNRGMFQRVLAGREGVVYDGGPWCVESLPGERSMTWKERFDLWRRKEIDTMALHKRAKQQ